MTRTVQIILTDDDGTTTTLTAPNVNPGRDTELDVKYDPPTGLMTSTHLRPRRIDSVTFTFHPLLDEETGLAFTVVRKEP